MAPIFYDETESTTIGKYSKHTFTANQYVYFLIQKAYGHYFNGNIKKNNN